MERFFKHYILKPFSDRTTPRWIILLLDLLIVAASYSIIDLFGPYRLIHLGPSELLRNYLIIVGIFFIVSLFCKSYAYIIRLAAITDLARSLLMCFISFVILAAANVATLKICGELLFSMWTLGFTVLLSFCIMMAERVIVKYLYYRFNIYYTGRERVMVIGSSIKSIILANTLSTEYKGKYNPIALLSLNSKSESKSSINNFPVYRFDSDTFSNLVKTLDVSAVIISASNLKNLSNEVATAILATGTHIMKANFLEDIDLESSDNDTSKSIIPQIKQVQIEDLLGRSPIISDSLLVRKYISDQTILITGACGSIGSEIVRQVATNKAKLIVCIDQAETPMHDLILEMKEKFPDTHIVPFIGSVYNTKRMEVAFLKYRPDFVIHAAAYKHVPMMEINPTEAIITNVLGSKTIADLSAKHNVKKFVMVSTDKAVNPTNVMGVTKRISEIYTQSLFFHLHDNCRTQFITTRFGNVLGSNGSVIPLFRRQIENGGPVTITHKDIIRYFMTIPEACSLVLEAGCMGNGGEIYIFDMGKPMKIYDLAEKMISLAGFRPGEDIKIEEIGLRPGEKLYEELLNDKETTTATINERIMIAKVNQYEYGTVSAAINEIISFAQADNEHDMILAMKKLIPEFKSNNSVFEAIDNEISQ